METEDFPEWLNKILKTKSMSQAELARRSGVSPSQISKILNRISPAGIISCIEIADALKMRREIILRKAGWLEPITESDDIIEQVLTDMGVLHIQAKRTAARMVHAIREEVEEYRT